MDDGDELTHLQAAIQLINPMLELGLFQDLKRLAELLAVVVEVKAKIYKIKYKI